MNFTGDTQDGSPANGAINFTYLQHTVGVFLQNNPSYPFGLVFQPQLGASPSFSQSETFVQLPTTGGGPINCYQKPAVIPPPLVYSFTFDLRPSRSTTPTQGIQMSQSDGREPSSSLKRGPGTACTPLAEGIRI